MDQTEQRYIDDLFYRLRSAEDQGGPRDPQAERYIRDQLARQPGAPYYMAQAIIVQEEALKAAQQRIEDLEREAASRPAQAGAGGGSFLGGLFGGGPTRQTSVPPAGSVPRAGGVGAGGGFSYPREGREPMQPQSPVAQYGQTGRGGGFLAGAMQTAAGVAGGILLGNMIGDLLGGDKSGTAQAGEAAKPEAGGDAAKTEGADQQANAGDQAQQNDDPFANVEETQYDADDSFLDGGDFDGGFDI